MKNCTIYKHCSVCSYWGKCDENFHRIAYFPLIEVLVEQEVDKSQVLKLITTYTSYQWRIVPYINTVVFAVTGKTVTKIFRLQTDGRTDRQTDRRTDMVKTIYPLNFVQVFESCYSGTRRQLTEAGLISKRVKHGRKIMIILLNFSRERGRIFLKSMPFNAHFIFKID